MRTGTRPIKIKLSLLPWSPLRDTNHRLQANSSTPQTKTPQAGPTSFRSPSTSKDSHHNLPTPHELHSQASGRHLDNLSWPSMRQRRIRILQSQSPKRARTMHRLHSQNDAPPHLPEHINHTLIPLETSLQKRNVGFPKPGCKCLLVASGYPVERCERQVHINGVFVCAFGQESSALGPPGMSQNQEKPPEDLGSVRACVRGGW